MLEQKPQLITSLQFSTSAEREVIDRVPTQQELVAAGYSAVHGAMQESAVPLVAAQESRVDRETRTRVMPYINKMQAEGVYTPQAADILLNGKDGDTELGSEIVIRSHIYDPAKMRIGLANLNTQSPRTYEAVRDGRVVGFHGTRSIALAGMLKTGKMISAAQINALGENAPVMTSGEHYAHGAEGQSSISFSNLASVETSLEYANYAYKSEKMAPELIPEMEARIEKYKKELAEDSAPSSKLTEARAAAVAREEAALEVLKSAPRSLAATMMQVDFAVMVGINGDFVEYADENPDPRMKHGRTQHGVGSMGEFRPLAAEIPLEALPVIAVPAAKVAGVQKIFEKFERANKIVPIEDLYEAFVPDQHNMRGLKPA